MTTYILLRNNKESAPCTLEDLKHAGLKATDQVWVEGQSVCWLSPGQIPELKNLVGLAPVVAEIPQTDPVPVADEKKWAAYAQTSLEAEIPETKYSKPLDESKEIYLKNLEKRNKGFQVPPQIRKAGIYAGLVLVGIIAGILIKKTGAQKDPVLSAEIKPVPNEIAPSNTTTTDSGTISLQDETTDLAENDQSQLDPVNTITREIKKAISKTAENPLKQSSTTDETIPAPVTDVLTETEEKREEEKPVKKISINEIKSQVSVKTNDYSVGSFGGIKNLKLTITNHSKYELDKVAVEVQYLKPMNEFLRSELVSVQSLGPGETKVIEVTKSTRGVKVNCKVTSIHSKDFSDDTAGH